MQRAYSALPTYGKIKATVREGVVNAFGGRFAEVIVGGAAFNQEVEQFLHMIEFPYTVGYLFCFS